MFLRRLTAVWVIGLMCCHVQGFSYDPPVGIPNPKDFFDGFDPIESVCPDEPDNWNHDIDHWYYVNNQAENASDAGNGNRLVPRKTIPTALQSGDVVIIEGGPYHERYAFANIRGTAANPVWIRGANSNNKVVIQISQNDYTIRIHDCSYMIFENIIIDGSNQDLNGEGRKSGAVAISEDSNHLVFRHIDVRNFPETDFCENALAGIIISMTSSWAYGETNQYHVFYDINMNKYRVSDWPPSCESGGQGITLQDGVDHIWILNSRFREIAEDAIHIIGYHGRHDVSLKRGPHDGLPNYIYIGGNSFYRCGENAVDIKESNHVIVSQNVAHHFRCTKDSYGWGGAGGQAIVINNEGESNAGGNESAKNTWIIYNRFYDLVYGIYDESGNSSYLVGNLIYDMVPTQSSYSMGISVAKIDSYLPAAVEYVVNNTIYNFPKYGIYLRAAHDVYCRNNIISNLVDQTGYHLRAINIYGIKDVKNQLLFDQEEVRTNNILCEDCIYNKDPLFVDISAKNFHLQKNSPAIDAGIDPLVVDIFYSLYGLSINVDLSNTQRPQGSAWDIGAYEYVGTGNYADEDVNQDGAVTVNDVQIVVNVILGTTSNNRADVNGSGTTDVQDVQAVVNEVIG